MKTYVVRCTVSVDYDVVVEAKDKKQAQEKIGSGRYKRLGKPLSRGFIIVGEPQEQR